VSAPDLDPKVRVELGLGVQLLDPALRLQARDGFDYVGTREPVEGREGVALGIRGTVVDDQRVAQAASSDDRERDGGLAPELRGYRQTIRRAGYFREFSTRWPMTCGFSQVRNSGANRPCTPGKWAGCPRKGFLRSVY
jgi:hypothetical protein